MKNCFLMICILAPFALHACGSDDDSSDNSIIEKHANGESCTKPDECTSNYCNAESRCDDLPRENLANGESCTKPDECASNYCNADSRCDDLPRENLANGKYCTKSAECASNYCDNVSARCDDPPRENLANGESCTKSAECTSNYCNPASAKCDDQPITGAANGAACNSGSDCNSGYCSSDKHCAQKPVVHKDYIALQDIPTDQINADKAACDPDTFVAHCNGNEILWCEKNEDGQFTVHTDTCDTNRPTCGLTLLNGKNHVVCIGSDDACKAGNKDDIYCDRDDYGYEISINYSCIQFEDGTYNYAYSGIKHCAGKCTKKSCTEQTCDPEAGHSCSDDGGATLECYQTDDGRYIYFSYNCSSESSTCTLMENWATCYY